MEKMTFKEAMAEVLLFGKYDGATVHEVGSTDDGLQYLDWLLAQSWFKERDEFEAVSVYLKSPGVASRLEE